LPDTENSMGDTIYKQIVHIDLRGADGSTLNEGTLTIEDCGADKNTILLSKDNSWIWRRSS
jgi:hypothetical protein